MKLASRSGSFVSLSLVSLSLALASACGSAPPPATTTPQEVATPAPTEGAIEARESLTVQQCEDKGGTIVGDIGDGATSRPDYVCPSGQKPLGNALPPDGGPMPIEGSVCCPR
ncbi:MAG: hypothetical protein R3B48_29405 [Kofleriaceae bacterium]